MAIATYANLAIFGGNATVQPAREPRAQQINEYPGIDGRESLDLGGRGGVTAVSGTWFCDSEGDLAALLATWEALCDGTPRVLVDTLGRPWSNVLLQPYKLDGRRAVSPHTGAAIQRFGGSLIHLI